MSGFTPAEAEARKLRGSPDPALHFVGDEENPTLGAEPRRKPHVLAAQGTTPISPCMGSRSRAQVSGPRAAFKAASSSAWI